MKYVVSMAIEGRIDIEVEANSIEKAKEKAESAMCNINYDNLECIDYKAVNVTDENGTLTDY